MNSISVPFVRGLTEEVIDESNEDEHADGRDAFEDFGWPEQAVSGHRDNYGYQVWPCEGVAAGTESVPCWDSAGSSTRMSARPSGEGESPVGRGKEGSTGRV